MEKKSFSDSPLSDIRIGQITAKWASAQKIKAIYSAQMDSTSLKAKKEAFADEALNEQLVLYVTDQQIAGRGRGQNNWTSTAAGTQLLSTWSFMIDDVPQPILSPLMGLAVYRAAQATWPFLNWSLKAPNDLYLNSKKIGGLLIETLTQGNEHRLLIGFGLNVIAAPEEVSTATCLVDQLSEDAPLLAEDWITFLERLLFEFSFSLQLSFEPLNTTSIKALLTALNQFPLLKEKYVSLDSSGNLITPTKKISWSEL